MMVNNRQETLNPVIRQQEMGTQQGMDSTESTGRWTYAIPLEIIYTTPLSNWNLFNLTDNGVCF